MGTRFRWWKIHLKTACWAVIVPISTHHLRNALVSVWWFVLSIIRNMLCHHNLSYVAVCTLRSIEAFFTLKKFLLWGWSHNWIKIYGRVVIQITGFISLNFLNSVTLCAFPSCVSVGAKSSCAFRIILTIFENIMQELASSIFIGAVLVIIEIMAMFYIGLCV